MLENLAAYTYKLCIDINLKFKINKVFWEGYLIALKLVG